MLAEITERGRATAEQATALLHDGRFGTGPLDDDALDAITELLRDLRATED
jgi:hypothetical protein